MSQLSDTHDRYDLASTGDNVREDLANIIYRVGVEETPFMTRAGRAKSTNTLKEWLSDDYAAAATNAQVDGDTFANDALSAADRLGNYHQISWKVVGVSRRANRVNTAGRKRELQEQLAKVGVELKRDMEYALVGGGGPVDAAAGSSSTAGKLAPLSSWLRTNTNRAGTGADPTLSSTTYGTPTGASSVDGSSTRALSEATLLSVVRSAYEEGGMAPWLVMVGAEMKQRISQYMFSSSARIATQYQDQGSNPRKGLTVNGSVDYYYTDFGLIEVAPNRFQRERDVFVLDMDKFDVSYIDSFTTEQIAKTSDSDRRVILSDYTLVSKNEASSGVVADIDSTTAVVA